MKQKILLLLSALLLGGVAAQAQSAPYGNEWIDVSKTYYKFKVGTEGAVRIPRSVLNAAGLPASVAGSNFILYREGVEVPLMASAEVMSASDYLEFWGNKADGKFDKQLYVRPSAQPDDRISLFTDTACYYLTYDAGTTHQRYTNATAAIPVTPPAPPAYCMATVATHFKSGFSAGATYLSSDPFPSAEFDEAEGYVDALWSTINQPLTGYQLATPNVVSSAPVAATLNTTVVTQSYSHTHEATLKLNNVLVADSTFGTSESKHFSVAIPASGLTSSVTTPNNILLSMLYFPNTPLGVDRYGTSFLEIVYPRNFDVSGLATFRCVLPASSAAQYVEFLNYSGGQPRLYDSAARKVYDGDVSVAGKVRFYLQPSLQGRTVLLYSAAAMPALALDKTIHFKDYSAAGVQANYVIITNKALRQGSNDYVKDYAAYRASFTGGQYDTAITDVTDLYDAFAYGYDIHPLAIRNYLRFAYNQWAKKPAYVTLIGRGILYSEYAAYHASPAAYNFPIVPTYGDPGSDALFVNFGQNNMQQIAIGRISVWNAGEIGQYLSKIKTYEAGLAPAMQPDVQSEFWKKQVLHIAAGSNTNEQHELENDLSSNAPIIKDTLTGYQVFANSSSGNGINPVNSYFVDSMLSSGVQLLSYLGHASSTGFQYALNTPEQYHSLPRTPYFLALGCDVSQMFALNTQKTISERWMLQPTGGSIAVMASCNLGIADFLRGYQAATYRHIAYKSYGGTLGDICVRSYNEVLAQYTGASPYYITQIQNLIFAGDPALRLASAPKPDYHIPSNQLAAVPGNVTTATDSFRLRITAYNLARAVDDTVLVEVRHRAPGSNKDSLIRSYRIANLLSTQTDYVWVPVNAVKDLGLNVYTVTIDADNKVDEVSETNNAGTLSLFIYSDNLVPVYPKEFAIVNQQGITLKASTLNPFRPAANYRLQMDTTILFNSPLRQETVVNSPGGVIKWKPNLLMQDSIVYYWRAAFSDVPAGKDTQWTASSFIYLAQGSPGWNQSHYYQYLRDGYDNETLDSDRQFRFAAIDNQLVVHNTIKNNNTQSNPDLSTFWNEQRRQGKPQASEAPFDFESLQIMVIDSVSGKWWISSPSNTAGAYPPVSNTNNDSSQGYYDREFKTTTPAGRHAAMRYLDSIPAGNFVIIKNVLDRTTFSTHPNAFVSTWQADATIYGSGNTLYDAFKRLQFDVIDSFTSDRVFIFVRQKGRNGIPVMQLMTPANSPLDTIVLRTQIPERETHGAINSTVIGPAKSWQSLKWKTTTNDVPATNDSASVTIYGIDSLGVETRVYYGFARDTSLSFIDSARYPNIRLVWGHGDSTTHTAPQAGYWRVLYSPVPEAALNPAAYYTWTDSLHVGQTASLGVAIENLTEIPMDSMLVRYKVIDASGNSHLVANKRYRKLPGNDTLHATLTFDPAPYPGLNNLFVEANPDNDQREQYHPNNLGYLPLKVVADKSNPLLDVTFDGQHILDGDIVSSKPFISIRLKDENPYLPLNDTSLVSLAIRYPDDAGYSSRKVVFDGDTAKFIPATIGVNGRNEAMIEYRPTFKQDGRYDLIVTAKDRSSNYSGTPQPDGSVNTAGAKYQSSFEVINKPMITNVLNYPNPFSTATAFVFTLTGSQIPSQFKIQILTVTGKVVREIMKNELGPLHIGRNITQYQWDGKDQYGQLLGNGVYMYRVVTTLAGNDMERFEGLTDTNTGDGAGASVDKYFKNGWGKMYIMR